jgi:hypothetical protein
MRRLLFRECTRKELEKLFLIKQVNQLDSLDEWLAMPFEIDEIHKTVLGWSRERLKFNFLDWNEQELALNFIGPIISLVNYSDSEGRFNEFNERTLTTIINDIELYGNPDGIIASGRREPEIPIFCLHEYKKELDVFGDPIGQVMGAMLVSQALNTDKTKPVYGCWVAGSNWYFLVLEEKKYAISQGFNGTTEDIFDIYRILQGLKSIIIERITELQPNTF